MLPRMKPIYDNGKLPENLCIEHCYVSMLNMVTGRHWYQCKFCSKESKK